MREPPATGGTGLRAVVRGDGQPGCDRGRRRCLGARWTGGRRGSRRRGSRRRGSRPGRLRDHVGRGRRGRLDGRRLGLRLHRRGLRDRGHGRRDRLRLEHDPFRLERDRLRLRRDRLRLRRDRLRLRRERHQARLRLDGGLRLCDRLRLDRGFRLCDRLRRGHAFRLGGRRGGDGLGSGFAGDRCGRAGLVGRELGLVGGDRVGEALPGGHADDRRAARLDDLGLPGLRRFGRRRLERRDLVARAIGRRNLRPRRLDRAGIRAGGEGRLDGREVDLRIQRLAGWRSDRRGPDRAEHGRDPRQVRLRPGLVERDVGMIVPVGAANGGRGHGVLHARDRRAGEAAALRGVPAVAARVLAAGQAEVEGLVEGVQLVRGGGELILAPRVGHRLGERRSRPRGRSSAGPWTACGHGPAASDAVRRIRTCSGCRTVRRTTR